MGGLVLRAVGRRWVGQGGARRATHLARHQQLLDALVALPGGQEAGCAENSAAVTQRALLGGAALDDARPKPAGERA